MRLGLGLGIVLLLILAAGLVAGSEFKAEFPSLSNKEQDNCTYTIIIETSCTKGAGTTSPISVRFGDSTSIDILSHHLTTDRTKMPSTFDVVDERTKPFQECATDAFKVTGRCTNSHVCYLYLKQRGEDNWRPGRAQVLVSEYPGSSSKNFYFRRVLPRGVWNGHDLCEGVVTPFGIRKARKVFEAKHGMKSL